MVSRFHSTYIINWIKLMIINKVTHYDTVYWHLCYYCCSETHLYINIFMNSVCVYNLATVMRGTDEMNEVKIG